ncbi:MAG TPA: hypothetical protein VJI52_03960 [Candidatus Nanoarchaeia archaeon]|nr:hypothetical protein [Candidatus Nanoarchaeia archaeon]
MKKILVPFLVLMLVVIAACGQRSASNIQEPPVKEAVVDSAADSFGNSVDAINSDENDTSASQLNGVDQGLSDVENI